MLKLHNNNDNGTKINNIRREKKSTPSAFLISVREKYLPIACQCPYIQYLLCIRGLTRSVNTAVAVAIIVIKSRVREYFYCSRTLTKMTIKFASANMNLSDEIAEIAHEKPKTIEKLFHIIDSI